MERKSKNNIGGFALGLIKVRHSKVSLTSAHWIVFRFFSLFRANFFDVIFDTKEHTTVFKVFLLQGKRRLFPRLNETLFEIFQKSFFFVCLFLMTNFGRNFWFETLVLLHIGGLCQFATRWKHAFFWNAKFCLLKDQFHVSILYCT